MLLCNTIIMITQYGTSDSTSTLLHTFKLIYWIDHPTLLALLHKQSCYHAVTNRFRIKLG